MPVNLQEKTIPSSATLLTLALVTLWSTRSVRAQNNCVSLASSKACPAFDQFYVGLPGLADRYSYMANVTDVASFDKSLFAYVKTTGDYLLPLGCNSNFDNDAPYARYSLSRLCAGLIQDANDSLPCNFQHNLTPPPLCKTTCDAWISSIDTITSGTSVCQDSVLRNNTISNLQNQCASWQGYNGTASESCISGSVNEPDNCGFQDDMETACQFCDSSTDSCCQSVSCKKGLSAGAVAGIVVGCVVGTALIALAAFCFCSRRKRVRNDRFKFTTYVAPPRDEYANHRDSSRTSVLPLNSGSSSSSTNNNNHNSMNTINNEPPSSSSCGSDDYNDNIPTPPASAPPPAPPPPALQQPRPEDLYMVVHPYPPQMGDELGLHVGDIIYVALPFDDGWALGINAMTGLKGAFPMVCVQPVPRDVLDEMMASQAPDDDSSKVLIEDGDDMMLQHQQQRQQQQQELEYLSQQQRALQQNSHHHPREDENPFADTPPPPTIRYPQTRPQTPPRLQLINVDRLKESVRRSMSLGAFTHSALPRSELTNHSNIPKRTASMRTSTYGYAEAESPTSPTLNTPFFDVSPLSNTTTAISHFDQQQQQQQQSNHYHLHDTYELHEQRHSSNSNNSSNSTSSSDHFQWNSRSKG